MLQIMCHSPSLRGSSGHGPITLKDLTSIYNNNAYMFKTRCLMKHRGNIAAVQRTVNNL